MKIAVAMSGGVDSSSAAALLKEQGITRVSNSTHRLIVTAFIAASITGKIKRIFCGN
jgi:predicted PP-loop superfamily ATPase